MNCFNKHPCRNGPARGIYIASFIIPLFIVVVSGQFNTFNNNNRQIHQAQRTGQQNQQNKFLYQQQRYQQRNLQAANSGKDNYVAASYSGAKFINTPVGNLNGTAGALVQVQLLQYSDPGLALPNGYTCACPQGLTCPYLQAGAVSCSFSFTIIMSASNQSVQYIATPFTLVSSSPISSGDWTTAYTVNMTTKPMAIDIFVLHLGVVINQATGNLENFDHLTHIDTFVVPLYDYQATPYGSITPSIVQSTVTGQLLGTTLQLAYSVQCVGGKQGPNCDLICSPAPSNSQYAACTSIVTSMSYSCMYSNNIVSGCQLCQYGLQQDQTACYVPATAVASATGVSPAFRVWTIVLGCLLGVAVIFIILLVIIFVIAQKRGTQTKPPQARYMENTYSTQMDRPLLYRDDDEWRRSKTRATGGSGFSSRTAISDQEPSEDEFLRSNGASIARREAHV